VSDPEVFDVAIIGAGPAGLAAGLYTSRDRYSTLMLEKNGLPGGQIMLTEKIENYPGWERVGGPALIDHMAAQVRKFGTTIRTGQEVTGLKRRDDGLLVIDVNAGERSHLARVIILCPGSDYRQLGVPGETEMRKVGKVSYCATCDGAFYRDKNVLAIGGGNTAVEDTIYLATRFTRRVTLIHRRKEFRAQKVLLEELYDKAPLHNIEIKVPYSVERIVPNADQTELDHVEVRNRETGAIEHLRVDGVFIFVGMAPNTAFLKGFVGVNENGYIECETTYLRTAVPGVFVAGDCRVAAAMQLATACGDGVMVATMLKEYLRDPNWWYSGGATATSGQMMNPSAHRD
jgi:thioredoxin reductase (NADPH)